jgi:F0F1-type ATP synthase membrane subunit b/b'
MKNVVPMIMALGLVGVLLLLKGRRRRKPTALERLRESVEGALDDAEVRTQELRSRARKMRGDAKKRIEAQVHEVEERQKELRGRLDELKQEAGKLLERARS